MDLERSASINRSLGSRVAQCSLNGLADFLYRYTLVHPTTSKSGAVLWTGSFSIQFYLSYLMTLYRVMFKYNEGREMKQTQ